jgi:hypothetical protein
MRSRLPLLLVALSGCTFSPGAGFADVVGGRVVASLDATELETADGQSVSVSGAALSMDAVELQALQGADSVDFDPADPPEGYTLCHGDHCHNTAGELISYDVIIAELSGGSAAFEAVGSLAGVADLDLVAAAGAALDGRAALPLVDLSQIALPAPRLALQGIAGDGTRVDVDLRLSEQLRGELLYEMTRSGPAAVRLDVEVLVPDSLLLAVDVAALADAGEVWIDDPDSEVGLLVGEALRTSVVHGTLSPID